MMRSLLLVAVALVVAALLGALAAADAGAVDCSDLAALEVPGVRAMCERAELLRQL